MRTFLIQFVNTHQMDKILIETEKNEFGPGKKITVHVELLRI